MDEEVVEGPPEVGNVVLLSDCRYLQRKRHLLQQALREMLPCMMPSPPSLNQHMICAPIQKLQQSPPIFKVGKDLKHPFKGGPHIQQVPHLDGWHCCYALALHKDMCVGNDMRIHMKGEGLASSGMGRIRGSGDIKSASLAFYFSLDSAACL